MKKIKDYLFTLITPLTNATTIEYTIFSAIHLIFAIYLWNNNVGGAIPAPLGVLHSLIYYFTDNHFYDCLFNSIFLATKAMIYSLIISLLIGYMTLFKFFKPITDFVVKCRYLTFSGLIYIFIRLITDVDDLKTTLLLFGIIPFFATSLITLFNNINPQYYQLATTIRSSKWRSFFEINVRGQMANVYDVLKVNFAISLMMITMVEIISMSKAGLGIELYKEAKMFHMNNAIALIIIIFLLGVLIDGSFNKIKRLLIK